MKNPQELPPDWRKLSPVIRAIIFNRKMPLRAKSLLILILLVPERIQAHTLKQYTSDSLFIIRTTIHWLHRIKYINYVNRFKKTKWRNVQYKRVILGPKTKALILKNCCDK